MMKNRWQRKDLKRRDVVDAHADLRSVLRARIRDVRTSDGVRTNARGELRKRSRDASPSRVHNRCVETGRGRSVMRVYRRSRFVIRDRALRGRLPGVKKVPW
jgi:small subunit ribosomal protein S14